MIDYHIARVRMPFPIKLPDIRAVEPKAISVFIREGHPWMALAYGIFWLISTAAWPALIALVISYHR